MAADSQKFAAALVSVSPSANRSLVSSITPPLNRHVDNFGLTTKNRLASFVAETCEETGYFTKLIENASGLAYEGNVNLGNTLKGDGVKFKGRGLIQITGRYNYSVISKAMFNDLRLLSTPSLLEQPENAVLSALHYWKIKGLNAYADKADWLGLSIKINGKNKNGLPNGWALRQQLIQKCLVAVTPLAQSGGSIILPAFVTALLGGLIKF